MDINLIRKPITIQELVKIECAELDTLTVYRPENSGDLTVNSVIYLDDEQTEYNEETDEEIFPTFIIINNLEYYFNGDIASDIISNTCHQLKSPSIQDFLINFNYYDQHDCFYTF